MMKVFVKRALGTLAVVGAFALAPAGCSGADEPAAPPSDEEISYELFDSTVVLDESAMNSVSKYDEKTGELRFRNASGVVASLEPKKVLLGAPGPQTPRGLLRVVADVRHEGDELVLDTVPAPLQLAFRKLHVKFRRTITLPSDETLPALRPSYSDSKSFKWSGDFYAYDGDGDHSTKDDQMMIHAEAGTSYEFDLGIDTDWTKIDKIAEKIGDCLGAAVGLGSDCEMPDVTVGFYGSLQGNVALRIEGAAYKNYEAPFELGEAPLTGFFIGPLYFAPELEVLGKVSGGTSSDVRFEAGVSGTFEGGVKFSLLHGKTEKKPSIDMDAYVDNPKITLEAHARAELGVRLHVRLFDVMGPYVGLKAYAAVNADQSKTPCWDLHGGSDVELGLDIQLTSFGPKIIDWNKSYNIYDKRIASGSCDVVPESYHPDALDGQAQAEAYSKPTFSPWSNVYGGKPLYFLPPLGVGSAPMWLDISSTVDGRLLVGGSHLEALTKVREDGTPVWSYKYAADDTWYDSINSPYVLPGHAVPGADGTEFVEAYPYVLMNLEQDGHVRWASSVELPYRAASARWTSLLEDGKGGVYVTGPVYEDKDGYSDGRDALLAHFDPAGKLTWALLLGSPESREVPRQLLRDEHGVVVLGNTDDGTTQRTHWLARVSADGSSVEGTAIQLQDCTSSTGKIGAWATKASKLPGGDIVMVGRTIDSSFIVKVKPDGQVGWVEELKATRVADSGPQIQGLVVLPTSGYLVSGTIGYSRDGHVGGDKDMLWLATLDGAGHVQWNKRYAAIVPDEKSDESWDIGATMLGTKDGGVLLGGYTGAVEDGGLWLSKLTAKDGVAGFDSKRVEVGDVSVGNTGELCATSGSLALPVVAVADMSVKPLKLTAEVVDLTAMKLVSP